jgi:hypothetical protein
MPKPMIQIHNTETNEIVEREMTDPEYAHYQDSLAINAAQDKALADKEAAKAAIAERLGLSADELATLLA